MIKIATTLINNIQDYINDNPDMLKNMLSAGAVGAGAGGLLFGGGSKYETTGQKVKRRLKNALIGGAMASGAAALLTHGTKQLATALPASQETPLEAAAKIPSSTPARAIYGAIGLEAGNAMNKFQMRDGINVLRDSLQQSAGGNEFIKNIVSGMPEASLTNISRAQQGAQTAIEKLVHADPDMLFKALGRNGKGAADAETVKNITKILSNAGVDTSKMKDVLPGYAPIFGTRLSEINLAKVDKHVGGAFSKLKNKISKIDKLSDKIDANTRTGKWVAEKLTRLAQKAQNGDLRNINMDNKFVRSLINPKHGKGKMAALATAGVFAPELFSLGKKIYDTI